LSLIWQLNKTDYYSKSEGTNHAVLGCISVLPKHRI